MATNIARYREDLQRLIKLGNAMSIDLMLRLHKGELESKLRKGLEEKKQNFEKTYQRWFTEASAVIQQLLPTRANEFYELYRGTGKRKETSLTNYNIQDWLQGYRSRGTPAAGGFNDLAIVYQKFEVQQHILEAVSARFDSSLLDIRQLIQADVFDSELDAGRELAKKGFLRAAGALAGVVLERHLAGVAATHNLKLGKKSPTISDLNDALKNAGVFDIPVWRNIQRMGDLRNLCAHNKEREPTKEEVAELVESISKVTKTVY